MPRWPFAAAAVTFVASFVGGHGGGWWPALLWLPGVLGSFTLALWLEDRGWLRVTHARTPIKLALVAAGLVGGAAANFVVATVFGPLFLILGFDAGAYLMVQLFVFWFLAATVGGVPVIIVNSLTGRLFGSFRRRVQSVVLVLVGVAVFVAVGIAVAGIALIEALKEGEAHFLIGKTTVAGLDITPARFLEQFVPYIDYAAIIVLLASVLGAFYGIPAILSATSKIADNLMERVSPLAVGFDRLASGDRGMEIEEGGARELAHIIRRFNVMVTMLALAERMERAFGKYVSGHLLELIRSQHGDATVPASLREASVFFADIRGFTAMSEKLSPPQVVSILNRYFERVVQIISTHDGYLNKFIGDAVVVVFNGPVDQPDHAARATRCAIAIQCTVDAMNLAAEFPEIGAMKVGIGVSTGAMVCGNIGSSTQMEYTVIGDTVNLAARLTSKAAAGEVWVSEATAAMLPVELVATALEPMSVKGKDQPVKPFRAWPNAS
jgi:class 3 adenylate cyclase